MQQPGGKSDILCILSQIWNGNKLLVIVSFATAFGYLMQNSYPSALKALFLQFCRGAS